MRDARGELAHRTMPPKRPTDPRGTDAEPSAMPLFERVVREQAEEAAQLRERNAREAAALRAKEPAPRERLVRDRERASEDEAERASVAPKQERILRVSELNRAVRHELESTWRDVWVEGELSDVSRASSGHVYFTLNDGEDPAQIRGVLFRSDARRTKALLEDGERVRLRGQVTLYEPRGSYQMVARVAVPAGDGDLRAAFERLKRKLEAEGLFALERKRALPRHPRVVGVVTSPSGAAIHDIIRVAHGRFPVRIVLSACVVQGEEAPSSIARALAAIQKLPGLDVVILGRGGGAAEDLFAFNDERVVRAIASCAVPVVSAVGHEVDVTLSDLAADVRAATPSNAAEIVVPDLRVVVREVEASARRLERAFEVRLGKKRLLLERASSRVSDPRHGFARWRRRVAELDKRMSRADARRREAVRNDLDSLEKRLASFDPSRRLAKLRAAMATRSGRLDALGTRLVAPRRARVDALGARLEALSPVAILARGYAIVLHEKTGKALVSASDAARGDVLSVRLHEGSLQTRVEETRPGKRDEDDT